MASTSSRCSSPRGVTLKMPVTIPAHVNTLLQDSKAWRLLPESAKHDGTRKPCLYYGAVHFVRLFGKSIFDLFFFVSAAGFILRKKEKEVIFVLFSNELIINRQ